MFVVAGDLTAQQNGDLAIKSDAGNGMLVCLVYARHDAAQTLEYAQVIASSLNAAYSPGMTDLMVSPESLDEWLKQNPLPK